MTPERTSLRGMVYASMFGALTAIGAYIIIPLPPVPITLQTLFLNPAGALPGGYLGALSQVVYILLGVIGLPVFAGGKAGLGGCLHAGGNGDHICPGYPSTDSGSKAFCGKSCDRRRSPVPSGRYCKIVLASLIYLKTRDRIHIL